MEKLSKLIDLKEQRRSLWDTNCWSREWFSNEDKKKDKKLSQEIMILESEGIYCKCQKCGTQDDNVDFTSETPREMICLKCSDKLRRHIKDKCGLV